MPLPVTETTAYNVVHRKPINERLLGNAWRAGISIIAWCVRAMYVQHSALSILFAIKWLVLIVQSISKHVLEIVFKTGLDACVSSPLYCIRCLGNVTIPLCCRIVVPPVILHICNTQSFQVSRFFGRSPDFG